jgi:hypothetical protein
MTHDTEHDLWTLRPGAPRMSAWDCNLVGFRAAGVDGDLGRVTATSGERGGSYVVIDLGGRESGRWVLGRKVLVPGQFVRDVDHSAEVLRLDLSVDDVRGAPSYVEDGGFAGGRPGSERHFAPLAAAVTQDRPRRP